MPRAGAAGTRWRTVDIVVTAVLGVAFGVVFWAWNLLWAAVGAAFTAFPPGQAFMYGVWLLPAVVAPLIVRKPGAALFAELIAAIVSAAARLRRGAAGRLSTACSRASPASSASPRSGYRRYGWLQALLAAALAGRDGGGAGPRLLLPATGRPAGS